MENAVTLLGPLQPSTLPDLNDTGFCHTMSTRQPSLLQTRWAVPGGLMTKAPFSIVAALVTLLAREDIDVLEAMMVVFGHLCSGLILEQRAGTAGGLVLVQVKDVDTDPEGLVSRAACQGLRVELENGARKVQAAPVAMASGRAGPASCAAPPMW